MKYFFLLIKKLFLSRYVFFLPKRRKIVIFDQETGNFLKKIIKKNFFILETRFSEINMFVIFKMLFNFRFSSTYYLAYYINFLKPKIVITFTDNDIKFYRLKKFFPSIKFISIQNGLKTKYRNFFSEIQKKKFSKQDLKCDLILTFNNVIGDHYKKFIDTKTFSIGSLKNNLAILKTNNNNKNILFLSQFRPKISENKNFFFNTENKILPIIKKFCVDYNLCLNILFAKNNFFREEQSFYNSILGEGNFKILRQKQYPHNYWTLDGNYLIVSIDSTMGYEALSRNKKVVIFSNRKLNEENKKEPFGWPLKFRKDDFFYTQSVSKNIIYKKLENIFFMKTSLWREKSKKFKKVLVFKKKKYTIELLKKTLI